jgi:predicted nucleic-acid-binding protein
MIGIDTNVVVRYIVQDDAEQARAASNVIEKQCTEEHPGFLSLVVLAELVWVLERAYGYRRAQMVDVLEAIVAASELKVESPDLVLSAIVDYRDGSADFADYLIGRVHALHGCDATVTFDARAARTGLHRLVA